MGSKKGQNNFARHQKEKIHRTKDRILEELKLAVGQKIKFTDLNDLIAYVSIKIGIHRTTIVRNQNYLSTIREAFRQLSEDPQTTYSDSLNSRDDKYFILELELSNTRAELSKFKIQNKNLKNILSSLAQNRVQDTESGEIKNFALSSVGDKRPHPPSDTDFADTCMVLQNLLDLLEEKNLGIKIDLEKKQIIDSTEYGAKRVIANSTLCRSFLRWLDRRVMFGNGS